MTEKRDDQGSWKGKEWAGEDAPKEDEKSATWKKVEWVGDQGEGLETEISSADSAEGETSISGRGQGSGESHWGGAAPDADTATGGDAEGTPKA